MGCTEQATAGGHPRAQQGQSACRSAQLVAAACHNACPAPHTPAQPPPPPAAHRVPHLHVRDLVLAHAAAAVQAVHTDAIKGAWGAHPRRRVDLPPQPEQRGSTGWRVACWWCVGAVAACIKRGAEQTCNTQKVAHA